MSIDFSPITLYNANEDKRHSHWSRKVPGERGAHHTDWRFPSLTKSLTTSRIFSICSPVQLLLWEVLQSVWPYSSQTSGTDGVDWQVLSSSGRVGNWLGKTADRLHTFQPSRRLLPGVPVLSGVGCWAAGRLGSLLEGKQEAPGPTHILHPAPFLCFTLHGLSFSQSH